MTKYRQRGYIVEAHGTNVPGEWRVKYLDGPSAGAFEHMGAERFAAEFEAIPHEAALSAKPAQGGDYVLVPREPTEKQWGGLARDIVMWTRFARHNGADLHSHLRMLGREIPDWLAKEIPNTDQVPPKGTVAACIYKAMLASAPPQPIPAPDEALMPASMLSHMMPNPTKHAERLYSRDQMLNYGERIRNATLAFAPSKPIPTPDRTLREISKAADLLRQCRVSNKDGKRPEGQKLLHSEDALRKLYANFAALSRVAALSRARPEDDKS